MSIVQSRYFAPLVNIGYPDDTSEVNTNDVICVDVLLFWYYNHLERG